MHRTLDELPPHLRERIRLRKFFRTEHEMSACWEWTGRLNPAGTVPLCESEDLGADARAVAVLYAATHRVSTLDFRPLERTHACEHPACVNPHHHRPKGHI